MPEAFVAQVFCWSVGCLPRAFSGSSSGQGLLCILGVHLRMVSWLWLGSAFGVVAFVCFLVFPLAPLPNRRSRGLSSIVFSTELTVQCDGCLIWGLGWRAGLVAWLRVGQAYGVFHGPGFGLLVSILEHPTTICDTGIKNIFVFYHYILYCFNRMQAIQKTVFMSFMQFPRKSTAVILRVG